MTSSLRIVVADDEPILVEELTVYLAEMGHLMVGAAGSGKELVALCTEHQPDLVITDISMPDMDGLEAAMRIQEVRQTPVIVVTGSDDAEMLERAKRGNVMSYLVKPISVQNLNAAIEIATQRFREMNALFKETKELQQSLRDRKLIERAKGLLMQRAELTEPEAHRRLQEMASVKNRKMVDIARTIIDADDAFNPS